MSKRKNRDRDRAPIEAPKPSGPVALHVDLARGAWADLVAHARESLDAEVCGVLVGDVSEREDGTVVNVRATIRGTAAREARAHVTFTHETWNQIHEELDRKYSGLQIVGWYHTHPGFGVEFSAMDRFIQENFFSGKTQVAFLSDPLGSEVALAYNGEGGIDYLPRFWVDGREHAATMPGGGEEESGPAAVTGGGADVRRELEHLQARVNQLVQSLDEQQRNFYRMLTALVLVGCVGIVIAVTYFIWSDRANRLKPPEPVTAFSVPIKVGNDTFELGIGVVEWKVPPQYNALLDRIAKAEVEERKREEQEILKRMREEQKQQRK